MRNADKDITVYRHSIDANTGYDLYSRVLVQGVSVFSQSKVDVSKEGLQSADLHTLRIPAESIHMPDFSIKEGDLVVVGCAVEENPRPTELMGRYDHVITVTSVTDNTGKLGPHWKVMGK